MFEQCQTPSLSSIPRGKWGFASTSPHFTLPLHPQTLLRLLGTFIHLQNAGEQTLLALTDQNSQLILPHTPRTWLFHPLGLLCLFASPTSCSVVPRSSRKPLPTALGESTAALGHVPAHNSHTMDPCAPLFKAHQPLSANFWQMEVSH